MSIGRGARLPTCFAWSLQPGVHNAGPQRNPVGPEG